MTLEDWNLGAVNKYTSTNSTIYILSISKIFKLSILFYLWFREIIIVILIIIILLWKNAVLLRFRSLSSGSCYCLDEAKLWKLYRKFDLIFRVWRYAGNYFIALYFGYPAIDAIPPSTNPALDCQPLINGHRNITFRRLFRYLVHLDDKPVLGYLLQGFEVIVDHLIRQFKILFFLINHGGVRILILYKIGQLRYIKIRQFRIIQITAPKIIVQIF